MTEYYGVCDKKMKLKSKAKHLNSTTHKSVQDFIIKIYFVSYPNSNEFEKILKKHIFDYNTKYEVFQIRYLLKLLTNANSIEYIRTKPRSIREYYFQRNTLILPKIDDREQIIEMCITFFSLIRPMTYK